MPAIGGGLSAETLRELVEQQTRAALEDSALVQGATRVEVEAGSLDSRLQLADCGSLPTVEVDTGRASGRTNARVRCLGSTPWSIYVPVTIRAYREVVVTTRALQPGQIIAAADVSLEERDTLAGGSRALQSLDEAIGHSVRRSLAARALVGATAVEQPVLVKRGERVSLRASNGGIAVTANGEALADGRSGERIRVRNLQSQRVIEATVTGPGKAEVI
jgi:flagella basal body P-ring formation protein FlgA